jgi:hypothetical protein
MLNPSLYEIIAKRKPWLLVWKQHSTGRWHPLWWGRGEESFETAFMIMESEALRWIATETTRRDLAIANFKTGDWMLLEVEPMGEAK